MRYIYPFSAIVGQDIMKKALILNVIDPSIGGVLIRGEKGTAKSTAVRGLAALLHDIKVVKGCIFNCDPDDPSTYCDYCNELSINGQISTEYKKMKVVNLPVGSTEDRVVGTINIEKILSKGEKSFEQGILGEANRAILYIDEVNLLSDHIVDIILDAAAMGRNYIERDGISFSHPSKFILIGTMNPEEGDLRPQLLDRFGLCVEIKGIKDIDLRIEVVKLRKDFENNPDKFIKKWSKFDTKIQKDIISAKKILHKIVIPEQILRIIAQISIDLNVDGHRADIIMEKTAKAIAAYHGKREVSESEIREAARMVLPHRMRKNPFDELHVEQDIIESSIQKIKTKSDTVNDISDLKFSEKKK